MQTRKYIFFLSLIGLLLTICPLTAEEVSQHELLEKLNSGEVTPSPGRRYFCETDDMCPTNLNCEEHTCKCARGHVTTDKQHPCSLKVNEALLSVALQLHKEESAKRKEEHLAKEAADSSRFWGTLALSAIPYSIINIITHTTENRPDNSETASFGQLLIFSGALASGLFGLSGEFFWHKAGTAAPYLIAGFGVPYGLVSGFTVFAAAHSVLSIPSFLIYSIGTTAIKTYTLFQNAYHHTKWFVQNME